MSIYGVFLNPNEYTLAFPISYAPTGIALGLAEVFLLLKSETTLEFALPGVELLVPKAGVPDTLLTLIVVPMSNGTNATFSFPLSLGFSKSMIVVPG